MLNQEHTSLKDALSKEEVETYFNKIFQDQSNIQCFECGKKTKQWADRSHAIFLCLNCAALYKEIKWAIEVKSISLDLWSQKELQLLKLGGNKRFRQFLKHYELQQLGYKDKLKTKAAQHYRILLREELNGRQPPEPPIKEIGQQFIQDKLPLIEMTSDQLIEITKQKALWFGAKTKEQTIWLGGKTKEYGGKAIDSVSKKIQSGQLQEDAKKIGNQVKSRAKILWGFARSKIAEFQGKKKEDFQQTQKLKQTNTEQKSVEVNKGVKPKAVIEAEEKPEKKYQQEQEQNLVQELKAKQESKPEQVKPKIKPQVKAADKYFEEDQPEIEQYVVQSLQKEQNNQKNQAPEQLI